MIPDVPAVADITDVTDAMDGGMDVADVLSCDASVCDASCVDLQNDPRNCGACGMACTSMAPNTVATCVAGRCNPTLTCATDFADCDGNPTNGCETNTGTSAENCGRCRNVCPSGLSATAACVAGTCGVMCAAGTGNCDGNLTNGCEADLRRDATNCGACARACTLGPEVAHAHPGCADGSCNVACDAGFASCDMNPANGCETSTGTDTRNCGACGTSCDVPNGVGACTAGRCSFTCATGFADCDMNPANGCEVDTRTAPTACGRCGNTCPAAPNATPSCSGGACGVSCATGFGNCDGVAANGCEADLNASSENCGTCGTVCPGYPNASTTCVARTCTPACSTGYGNCDRVATNGCEIDIRTSAANCGACGRVCPPSAHASGACTASVCGIACDRGFADCDMNAANGCEVDLSLPSSCGACGRMCNVPHATPGCAMGVCSIASCNAGFSDCDGDAANGCETAGGCPT